MFVESLDSKTCVQGPYCVTASALLTWPIFVSRSIASTHTVELRGFFVYESEGEGSSPRSVTPSSSATPPGDAAEEAEASEDEEATEA